MNLHRIRTFIAGFQQDLPRSPFVWAWEVQSTFQQNWNLEAPNLPEMLDKSLHSMHSRRLWSRENFQPKAVLLLFAQMEPDQVRLMFRDLYRNEKDLLGRISRFRFLADEMLHQYREEGRRPLLAGHDQDVEAIMLYLALRYPDQYAPYDDQAFVATLKTFEVRELPVQPDPVRWSKVARTLYGLMLKEPGFVQSYESFLKPDGKTQRGSLWIVWDFIRFVAYGKNRSL